MLAFHVSGSWALFQNVTSAFLNNTSALIMGGHFHKKKKKKNGGRNLSSTLEQKVLAAQSCRLAQECPESCWVRDLLLVCVPQTVLSLRLHRKLQVGRPPHQTSNPGLVQENMWSQRTRLLGLCRGSWPGRPAAPHSDGWKH